MANERGVCMSCDAAGVAGDECPERICAKTRRHFIPAEHADTARAAPGGPDALIGQALGDWLIVGVLGQGGFGKVLLVLQRPLLRLRAALKLMTHAGSDPVMAARLLSKFENEAGALAVLDHPNIVRLLGHGRLGDQPWLVMEYVSGARTLHAEMREATRHGGRFPAGVARHVLGQILNALEAAHLQGIVHRDVKPENVMLQRVVGDDHFARLVDFGIAKFMEEGSSTSMVLGTPVYMAPEQLTARNIGPWTDLYALGVIAFELVVGTRPFGAKTQDELVRMKLDPAFDPAASLRGAPPAYAAFFRRALANDPARRFRSAAELRSAFVEVFATPFATPAPLPRVAPIVEDSVVATEAMPSPPPRPAPTTASWKRFAFFAALPAALALALVVQMPESQTPNADLTAGASPVRDVGPTPGEAVPRAVAQRPAAEPEVRAPALAAVVPAPPVEVARPEKPPPVEAASAPAEAEPLPRPRPSVSARTGGLSLKAIDPDADPKASEVKALVRIGVASAQKSGGHAASVALVFQRRASALRACYESRLKVNPNLAGKVLLHFTIGPSGRITTINVAANSTGDAALGGCIIDKVKAWRFDVPENGSVSFSFPIILSKN